LRNQLRGSWVRTRLLLLFTSALFFVAAGQTFAQTMGEVTGHISDPTAAAVPAAAITLTNTATNGTRTTVSTGSGDYTFPSVPPGFYTVKAEHAGFKTASSERFEVQVQQTVRLDLTLQIGQTSETVEVSAQADLLQAENASVGAVIENKAVTELPLNGRQYLNLVALSSNVDTLSPASGQAGSREGGERARQSISAAGQRIMFDYFTLDGVNNTDPDFMTYVVLPSIDAIQEFKVQTGVYPAEFGHQATQINVLTKSGGNDYHGTLFDFIRNDVFDAVPYAFTSVHPVKSPFKWNDWGFELDGPVRIPKLFDGRNKLFFMVNDEWRQQRQHSQGVATVPTPAMELGDMAGLSAIYDPLTGPPRTPFPNNVIPTSRLDPISQKLLKYYAASNLPGLTRNYVYSTSAPFNQNSATVRMDWVESSKSQWTGRYSWGDENQSNTGLNITGSKILTDYDQYLGQNTRTFTPTLVNQATYGYTRFFNSLGTLSAYTFDSVSGLSIPGLAAGDPSTWGVPSMTFAGDGFAGLGDSSDGPYVVNDNVLQFSDNLSWIHGKHTFRFGFEYQRQNFNQLGNQFSRGQFTFQPNATTSSPDPATKKTTGGDAFSEFLLGNIYTSTVAVSVANAHYQRNVESAFVDDTWKITPKFTLTLGLRYELTPPWYNQLGQEFNIAIPQIIETTNAPVQNQPFYVRQGNCSDPYEGLPLRWTKTPAVCSNGLLPKELMTTPHKNFAPRIAAAWSPDSKTVIRVGGGLFYNQDIGNARFDMARNLAARVSIFAGQNGCADYGCTWAQSTPAGQTAGGVAVAQVPPPYGFANQVNYQTAYTAEYVFNIQRQITNDWVVEAGYLGTFSRHLQGFQDANQAPPGGVGTAAALRTPYNDFTVIQLVQDGANGNYNSLALRATRRFAKGFSVIGSYTWSKSMDNTSGIRVQGNDTLFPQNSYCLRCEYGLSSYDVRHRFVASVLYDLPIGRGRALNITNPILNGVIGGWQAGGILTAQTGVPGTLSIGGIDNANTAEGGFDRPNATGVSPYLSNPTPTRYLNLAAFVEAPPGEFGNVGRNTIEGPGIVNLDAEVHKEFHMFYKESHILQFRLEAFNTLNHPNWSMPTLNILSGAAQAGQPATAAHTGFGTVGGTSVSMRQVQLGLKYTF